MFSLFYKLTFVLGGVGVVAGCAISPHIVSEDKIENVVAKRASERWSHVIKGDYIKAYDYFVSSLKVVKTPEAFVGSFGRGLRLESADFVSVSCSEIDRCIARYRIGAVVPVRGFSNQVVYREIDEVWLLESGQWGYFEK